MVGFAPWVRMYVCTRMCSFNFLTADSRLEDSSLLIRASLSPSSRLQ